jgi:hypothetical protein
VVGALVDMTVCWFAESARDVTNCASNHDRHVAVFGHSIREPGVTVYSQASDFYEKMRPSGEHVGG